MGGLILLGGFVGILALVAVGVVALMVATGRLEKETVNAKWLIILVVVAVAMLIPGCVILYALAL